jgi:hypothetical protein
MAGATLTDDAGGLLTPPGRGAPVPSRRGRACWAAVALFALAAGRSAFAVSPLVTDDADTVERGRLQLNAGWQFGRTGSVSLHAIPVNPVVGLSAWGELGATFGCQWRDGSGHMPHEADAEGVGTIAPTRPDIVV